MNKVNYTEDTRGKIPPPVAGSAAPKSEIVSLFSDQMEELDLLHRRLDFLAEKLSPLVLESEVEGASLNSPMPPMSEFGITLLINNGRIAGASDRIQRLMSMLAL